jgi:tRNA(Ile)-lysidine synthase
MISKVFRIIQNANIPDNAKVLCAVSGGIDSVVMLHVLRDYGFDCVVAHCNFKLRGAESDGDEKFVRDLAEKLEFKFICETFNTEEYANSAGVSIQMAARDLRYEWFHETAEKLNCDYIAVAHNSDDQIETIITNLIRGTGIRGLTGTKTVKAMIFRPLLEVSRKEIEAFATDNSIDFRTDSTNAKTKYSRNKIRHLVFPLMEEINTAYKNNILRSVNYLKDTEKILQAYVEQARESCLIYKEGKIIIDIAALEKFVSIETVLFELLVSEGVPKSLASDSVALLDSQTGKSCIFRNYEVLKDRGKIIVKVESTHNNSTSFQVDLANLEELKKFSIHAKIVSTFEKIDLVKSKNFAFLDFDKLQYPLELRKWVAGDKFKPFGMQNSKKISDFFSDQKISAFEKDEILLLVSNNKIAWVVGHRIDDRFKVTAATKKILVMEKV